MYKFLLLAFLVSCSAQERMQNLIKKEDALIAAHPALAHTDSITVKDTFHLRADTATIFIPFRSDTLQVDSILKKYIAGDTAQRQINRALAHSFHLPDATKSIRKGTLSLHIVPGTGGLRISAASLDTTLTHTLRYTRRSIQTHTGVSPWWRRAWLLLALLLLATLLYGIYKRIKE